MLSEFLEKQRISGDTPITIDDNFFKKHTCTHVIIHPFRKWQNDTRQNLSCVELILAGLIL